MNTKLHLGQLCFQMEVDFLVMQQFCLIQKELQPSWPVNFDRFEDNWAKFSMVYSHKNFVEEVNIIVSNSNHPVGIIYETCWLYIKYC